MLLGLLIPGVRAFLLQVLTSLLPVLLEFLIPVVLVFLLQVPASLLQVRWVFLLPVLEASRPLVRRDRHLLGLRLRG